MNAVEREYMEHLKAENQRLWDRVQILEASRPLTKAEKTTRWRDLKESQDVTKNGHAVVTETVTEKEGVSPDGPLAPSPPDETSLTPVTPVTP